MEVKKRNNIGILILSGLIGLAIATEAFTQSGQGGFGQGWRGGRDQGQGVHQPPFFAELTEQQQADLKALIQDLRDQGADRKAIREAVHSKLAEWGVELPQKPEEGQGFRGRGGSRGRGFENAPFFKDLTDAQQVELQTLIDELKAGDADRKTIRQAVHEKLKEWGVDLPGRGFRQGRGHGKFFDLLTETQKEEIRTMIQGLRENGASRQEIHEAVKAKLAEWGIERPEKDSPGQGKNLRPGFLQGNGRIRGSNNPNPFNPETTITYELDDAGQVTVSIFNTQGQLIRSLETGYKQAGAHQLRWDGKSDAGTPVPSGMYVYKIEAGNEIFSGRMMLMK